MTERNQLAEFCKRCVEKCAAGAGFTCDPSPRSHIYRLILVLAVAGWAFIQIKDFMTPDSWDSQSWYRSAAASELKRLPITFGGNASCAGCHAERMTEFAAGGHAKLACESCHGPVVQHADETQKTGNAAVDVSPRACLRCHENLPGRRHKDFPRYYAKFHRDNLRVPEDRPCTECHVTHSPKYELGWGF